MINDEFTFFVHLRNIGVKITTRIETEPIGYSSDTATEIICRSLYYPFGMELDGLWDNTISFTLGTEYQYNGKEKMQHLYDYGARYYYPSIGRFIGVDPLADSYPGMSPYAYALNNPLQFTDPTGMAASPIYDIDGNFLGTDDQGLKGEAIVMNKSDFKQGMSHDASMRKDLGTQGLSDAASAKLSSHYNNLPNRPDYDGFLTFFEAVRWYNNDSGKPLYVDATKINLLGINVENVKASEGGYINTYNKTPLNTGGVYGTIKFTLLNIQTGQVKLGGEGNYLDLYDFPRGSTTGRIADWLYPGNPRSFKIYCYKCTANIVTTK